MYYGLCWACDVRALACHEKQWLWSHELWTDGQKSVLPYTDSIDAERKSMHSKQKTCSLNVSAPSRPFVWIIEVRSHDSLLPLTKAHQK
eukprot:2894766-Amphidinium_carterae.3